MLASEREQATEIANAIAASGRPVSVLSVSAKIVYVREVLRGRR